MLRTPKKMETILDQASPSMDGNTTFEILSPIRTNEPSRPIPNVRKSIEELETRTKSSQPKEKPPTEKTASLEPPSRKLRVKASGSAVATTKTPVEAVGSPVEKLKSKYADRLTETEALYKKGQYHLDECGNIKTSAKKGLKIVVERLYQLAKEADSVKGLGMKQPAETQPTKSAAGTDRDLNAQLIKLLEEHKNIIRENTAKLEDHKSTMIENTGKIAKLKETLEKQTYASVAAAPTRKQPREQTALHSVVITAQDETETGEEVLNRIRKAVNAKEGGVLVDKIRKAKDRKVIVGCKTVEDRQKVKERIEKSGEHLKVEDVKNKDPLVIFKDVLCYNSDAEVLSALRKQNSILFKDLDDQENKMEIAYKKRTRNPLTSHIVMRVSSKIWQRMVEAEAVHIDLQRVRVEDQSPLVQCSLCLGYGHGRRFCKETSEICSHCGGHHMRTECPEWLAQGTASCCNCRRAKLDKTDHNAFSRDCPIRKKWDALARETIAYC